MIRIFVALLPVFSMESLEKACDGGINAFCSLLGKTKADELFSGWGISFKQRFFVRHWALSGLHSLPCKICTAKLQLAAVFFISTQRIRKHLGIWEIGLLGFVA